jgi:hypothetical protein
MLTCVNLSLLILIIIAHIGLHSQVNIDFLIKIN